MLSTEWGLNEIAVRKEADRARSCRVAIHYLVAVSRTFFDIYTSRYERYGWRTFGRQLLWFVLKYGPATKSDCFQFSCHFSMRNMTPLEQRFLPDTSSEPDHALTMDSYNPQIPILTDSHHFLPYFFNFNLEDSTVDPSASGTDEIMIPSNSRAASAHRTGTDIFRGTELSDREPNVWNFETTQECTPDTGDAVFGPSKQDPTYSIKFSCTLCGGKKSFQSNSNLNRHIKKVHNSSRILCLACQSQGTTKTKTFPNPAALERHAAKHHRPCEPTNRKKQ